MDEQKRRVEIGYEDGVEMTTNPLNAATNEPPVPSCFDSLPFVSFLLTQNCTQLTNSIVVQLVLLSETI